MKPGHYSCTQIDAETNQVNHVEKEILNYANLDEIKQHAQDHAECEGDDYEVRGTWDYPHDESVSVYIGIKGDEDNTTILEFRKVDVAP